MRLFFNRFYTKIAAGIILFATLFAFSGNFKTIYQEKDPFIAAYDAYGYYMYLPHLVQKGHLNISQEWLIETQEKRYGFPAYQLHKRENGNNINIYHIGLSFVQAPAFFTAHLYTKFSGGKADGLSKPYAFAMLINAILFIFLGLLFLYKFLRLFFEKKIATSLILITFFGTNYAITSYSSYMMQHLYLFALIAIFCYHFFKAIQTKTVHNKHFIYSVLIFGLCTVIRPTHVLLFILPVIYLWNYFPNRKSYFKFIVLFPISSFLWNLPQFIYWKTIGGTWLLTNLHTEEIILFDPHFTDFLFSYRKGWFLYTPLMLLLFPGFFVLFKKNRRLFFSLITCLFAFIWVFCSWECWHYASSFGSRVMVDLYPLCLLVIGFSFTEITLKKFFIKAGVYFFIFFTIVLNCFQSTQFMRGIISSTSMTKQHYWNTFGKLNTDKSNAYLLINRSDLNWPAYYPKGLFPDLVLKNQSILNRNLNLKISKNQQFASICLLDYIENDETQLEVKLQLKASDSLLSVIGIFEVESKYNTYNWNIIELALNKQTHLLRKEKLIFNLPEIRHRNDSLKMYLSNPNLVEIDLKFISIKATTLIRK